MHFFSRKSILLFLLGFPVKRRDVCLVSSSKLRFASSLNAFAPAPIYQDSFLLEITANSIKTGINTEYRRNVAPQMRKVGSNLYLKLHYDR
uniref:Secreted protein n=1 Tax=Vespula pensylvanica TaxID=30213 RepID=A0A834NZK4_VESPE|nr:hypothetical protein H0235_009814 [Vespula pensylvanica]